MHTDEKDANNSATRQQGRQADRPNRPPDGDEYSYRLADQTGDGSLLAAEALDSPNGSREYDSPSHNLWKVCEHLKAASDISYRRVCYVKLYLFGLKLIITS